MGIDFYIINKTKKEYVWTGRRNPVGNWDNLNKPVTLEMLDKSATNEFLEDVDMLGQEGEDYFITSYYYILNAYNVIKEYIKGNECVVLDDANSALNTLDEEVSGYKNNIDIEDMIFGVFKVEEGFE